MIKFDKLWVTLKEKNISQYTLIRNYNISNGQLDRLRKNANISTYTLNSLCRILDCRIEDICEYVPDPVKEDTDPKAGEGSPEVF